MKKFWVLIAVAAMTICMTACGSNDDTIGSETQTADNNDTVTEEYEPDRGSDEFKSRCGEYDFAEDFVVECLEVYTGGEWDYLRDMSYTEIKEEIGISNELYGPDVVYCRVGKSCIWVCFEVDDSCDYDIEKAEIIEIYMEK